MIEFKRPAPADRCWAGPLLLHDEAMCSESNFNDTLLWSRMYGQTICPLGERVLIRVHGDEDPYYIFPYGKGELAPAIEAISCDSLEHGKKLELVCVTEEEKDRLEALFPGRFEFESDRDGWDYVYDINRLADLNGKKLHSKRNHIHRFEENYPDWMSEPIGADNLAECVKLMEDWNQAQEKETLTAKMEKEAILESLELREELGMEGILIRAGGRSVAFAMGSFTTEDCVNVHFEKAYSDIQGAYAVVNREFARMIRAKYPQVKWFNREDDLGLEGLRKAKLSYYPDILLEKFNARER